MLYLDTETYSETPIKHGGYKYTAGCECMIVTYAIDKGDVQVWDATQNQLMPDELVGALESDTLITAHNSNFDRNVLKFSLGYDIPIERWRCTMVRAMSHGLPGSLDKLSEIFKLGDAAKHKSGKKLIHLFCKPNKGKRNGYETHPKEWAEFIEYAKSDIVAMRRLDAILPRWNSTDSELAYWFLDQRCNDRGVNADVELARAALRAVDKEQLTLRARTSVLTDGELESTTQRDSTLTYMLEAFGVSLPDMTMATIQRRLEDPDLPQELKELLQIRLQASSTSTAKYKSILNAVNDDGRVRGLIQFCGAIRTGRDAGRTIQPQNFPSRGLMDEKDIESGIRLMKEDCADLVYDNMMHLTSSCLRSTLTAGPGMKLISADLSNIEGRYLAWAAGEEWKLQAFRDFDTYALDTDGRHIPDGKGDYLRVGPDLYKLAYAKSFKIEPEKVDKNQRSIGKVQELALGYAGGVGAFLTFAAAYGIDLEGMANTAYGTLPSAVVKEAEDFYEWNVKQKRNTYGLSKKAFVVCEAFKRLWRQAHPMTVALWAGLADICSSAIITVNTNFVYGMFKARRDGQWLRLTMPSGRSLCFPYPQVDEKGTISFMGMNQYTRKWERITTHGGKLAENICQAGARDIFKYGIELSDKAGYPLVLAVHDEQVCEVPDSPDYTVTKLEELMATVPDWATGIPLAAEGFETYRYKK